MATTINIPQINFGNTPTVVQYCTIQYKVYTTTSYTVWNADVELNTNGTPVTPIAITGLTSGQTYNVQAISNCASPPSIWTITVTLP